MRSSFRNSLFSEFAKIKKKCNFVQIHSNQYSLKNRAANILLYPLSILYGLITGARNRLFDANVLKQTSFSLPIISIGNLSVGGTGKTPHTEFVLSILHKEWKTAVLSRGYKRNSKGFLLANDKSTSQLIGDEPYQIHLKFPRVKVAVDEKRVRGIQKLQQQLPSLQVVVLDDAFQHRYVHPGLSILLTDFNSLYSRDTLLPMGRLREWSAGSKRADIIVVTKCPGDLRPIDMRLIETELCIEHKQSLFFSMYEYADIVPVFNNRSTKKTARIRLNSSYGILLVAGIVSPQAIVEHLKNFTECVQTMFFPDHYDFKKSDFINIQKAFESIANSHKIILVTEKDASRIISNPYFPEKLKSKIFSLPIEVKILHDEESVFTQKIIDYVVENSRGC